MAPVTRARLRFRTTGRCGASESSKGFGIPPGRSGRWTGRRRRSKNRGHSPLCLSQRCPSRTHDARLYCCALGMRGGYPVCRPECNHFAALVCTRARTPVALSLAADLQTCRTTASNSRRGSAIGPGNVGADGECTNVRSGKSSRRKTRDGRSRYPLGRGVKSRTSKGIPAVVTFAGPK